MMQLSLSDAQKIIRLYPVSGEVISFAPYGEGHINGTYLLVLSNQKKTTKYILQLMNETIFHSIDKLMKNYVAVTTFIQQKVKKLNGDSHRETINVIFSKNNESFIRYKSSACRLLEYIDDTVTLQIVNNPLDFFYCATAFGRFYKLLDGFDASKLYEVLPDFHNTEKRYQNFLAALNLDKMKRAKTCLKEIDFINKRKHYYDILIKQLKNNDIPLRVTHNDTKLNNVLFDRQSMHPAAVIDLDTIMPGSLCFDFGDAIRFGCNSALEDEKDLNKVHFRFDLYIIFLHGFLMALGNNITQKEKENLAIASILMTIECGIRFLTDYLDGDHYFKTIYDTHNLVRAKTQFKLVQEMEEKLEEMNALIY